MFREKLLSEHMGMIGSSMVNNKIALKSSVIDVGNWVIPYMNTLENRQADLMLMV